MKTNQFLTYDNLKKLVIQNGFDRRFTGKTESIFALTNGYLGLRSSDEEPDYYNKPGFFVSGVFNKDVEHEVPEICNLADLITTPMFINEQPLILDSEDQYQKVFDIKNGSLSRSVTLSRQKNAIKINTFRFVSHQNLNFYAQKIEVEILEVNPENEYVQIEFRPQINAQNTNTGTQHFAEGEKFRPFENALQLKQRSTSSNLLVIHNLVCHFEVNGQRIKPGDDNFQVDASRRLILFRIKGKFKKGTKISLIKLMSVHTSIDDSENLIEDIDLEKQANLTLKTLLNADFHESFLESSQALDKNLWQKFLVKIDSNSQFDQLGLDFGLYHLNGLFRKNSTEINAGAKGLTGEGYQGHTYWDSEFFINPNYLFVEPSVVRNLLIYRYKGLDAARKKAASVKVRPQESNLEGAQFPWEMALPKDGEVCPIWGQVDIISGKQVPIASARQEIHVSADIAYAIQQYFVVTLDQDFMEKYGYEIIFDTAWFYTNRAEKTTDGKFEINDVMGPNEYKGNINNSAYINAMAKYNLDLALFYFEKIKNTPVFTEVLAKIPYKIDFEKIKNVGQNLVQQKPNSELIIAENDSFLELERNDISEFKMLGDAGKKLFSLVKGQKILASQLVKQADVVLLLYLFPELYSEEIRAKNFDFYEEITTHDSSLSAATYAIEAIRLNKIDKAYKLFQYGINIDLGQNMKSSDAGIHAGSLAAIWQMVVFGFGGLTYFDHKIHLKPNLPKEWNSLIYNFSFQGANLQVRIDHSTFRVENFNKKPVKIWINNQEELIESVHFFATNHEN
ncbi:glycosyl hydrolase family 65 protein [Mesomycoplasma ovipneumoniae]|uniref:glycosyl hydrolase family 65 protein n=1 Tax=Mesomycoplasma ovipneumoniae TaxID=29562 RepID=UPI0005C5CA0D|nr:glycosyl hydrolase family 65 protein [Mesomycoplasma ovipneumoniae]